MKATCFFLLLVLLSYSCSQINERTRKNFYDSKAFRHGIVPKESKLNESKSKKNKLSSNSITRGKALYESKCLHCHGKGGRGNSDYKNESGQSPTNLASLSRDVPDFKFFMAISRWKGQMPGWENVFSEKELRDLESYIKSFSSN